MELANTSFNIQKVTHPIGTNLQLALAAEKTVNFLKFQRFPWDINVPQSHFYELIL